jgi:hypothetical protein
MGGAGSGRIKSRERTLVEDCEVLYINEIVKYGITLYPVIAFIENDDDSEYLYIRYKYNSDGHLITANEKINLSVTHPNYGGVRYWMNCPECNNRVGKLYKPDESNEFKCRSCHDLIYQSQESNVYDGWLKKVKKKNIPIHR